MVRSRDEESLARANELTLDSSQEALRMYLQPTKSDDPQVEFYNRYERETIAYETEYMKQDSEDLGTILIFVGFHFPLITTRR
jgi:hypothetical protein